MTISLIFTVYNEARGIGSLLGAIAAMTTLPDEIVIVDAGSTDGTVALIKAWKTGSDIPTKLLVETRANISRGRNLAIENASGDVIAVTDGGCLPHPDWLTRVTEPLAGDPDVMVVYGGTAAKGRTALGRIFADFYSVKTIHQSIGSTEHSSRSMAFRRTAWEAVGGYPEWMTLAGEDTLFFIELDKRFTSVVRRDALVDWYHGTDSVRTLYRVHRRNSIGSGEANMNPLRHVVLIGIYLTAAIGLASGIVMPWVGLAASGGLLAFWSRQSPSVARFNRQLRTFVLLPVIFAVRDAGIVVGYVKGRMSPARAR